MANTGNSLDHLRIAIIHEWFDKVAGSEWVVKAILEVFPHADIFSLVDFFSLEDRALVLQGKQSKTSFIQHLPFSKSKFRSFLPLFPLAIEQLDLSEFDIIISSSHAVAHGILKRHDQLHISYTHSPMRYAWDFHHEYLKEANLGFGPKGLLARYFLHKLRLWDLASSNRVDHFVANSNFIKKRIRGNYGKDSTVVYPPVDTNAFRQDNPVSQDYFFTAGRLVSYKRTDIIIEAFRQYPHLKLKIAGVGEQMAKLKKSAPANVEFLGRVTRDELIQTMQNCRAFVFAAEEDFGIAPVEALAAGKPVIAYGKGGALETIEQGLTGIHFPHQTIDSLASGIEEFLAIEKSFDPEYIIRSSERFSWKTFKTAFGGLVAEAWVKFDRS